MARYKPIDMYLAVSKSGLMVVSVSSIHDALSKGATLSVRCPSSHAVPSASGMRFKAFRRASSEMTLRMPKSPGLMPSQRMCVFRAIVTGDFAKA